MPIKPRKPKAKPMGAKGSPIYNEELDNRRIAMYLTRIKSGVFPKPVWPVPSLSSALGYPPKKKRELLAKLRLAISGELTPEAIHLGVSGFARQIENFANQYDAGLREPVLHLTGLADELTGDEHYPKIERPLNQLAIDNLEWFKFSSNPWLGLGFGLMRVVSKVRTSNRMKQMRTAGVSSKNAARLSDLMRKK